MLRPTSTLLDWATDAGARITPSPALALAGWIAGTAIPAKAMNALFGQILDWLKYLVTSAFPDQIRVMAQGFGWVSQWDTLTAPGIGTPGTLLGVLSFVATASTQPAAMGTISGITAGGTLGGCVVRYNTAWTGGVQDVNMRVDVLDHTGTLVQTYTAALPDTVSAWANVTLTPTITPAPDVVGPLSLVVRFQSAVAEVDDYSVSLEWIEINFD